MPVLGTLRRTARRLTTAGLLALTCLPSTVAAQNAPAPGTTRLPSPGTVLAPSVRRAPPANPVEAQTPQILSSKEQRYLIERIDPERTLDVTAGRPSVLRLKTPPFRDQVGDPEIVDVISLTESELSITGKKVGSTVLNLWFKDPHNPSGQEVLSYLLRVSEDPERSRQYDVLLENLERDLNRGFPNSVVDLSYVGSQVVVRGKAKDIEEATHIVRIVAQSLPTDEQGEQAAATVPVASPNTVGPSPFSPNVIQPTSFQAAEGFTIDEIVQAGGLDSIARGEAISGANATQINNRVVNMLEIAGVHQVMLKVTLAEVVRDSGRSLIATTRFGVDSDNTSDISFTHQTGLGRLTFQTEQFFLRFDALKRLGLARSLSEPNLTTLSGQPANFLVGGQFPILESVSTVAAVNQNITYIPFGIQLSVLPTVTDGDRVRLQLQATISETDGNVNGFGNNDDDDDDDDNDPSQPPSLTTRTVTSTVELRDTESLALAGLIRSSLNSSSARVPFLGDLPYVGNLFSTKTSDFQEQELLVIVTPYLVSPVPADMPLALPGSDTFEPDDMEFFIRGAISGSVPEDYRTPVRSDSAKIHAFRCSEQKYIIGLPGHSSGRPLPACPSPANQLLREVP